MIERFTVEEINLMCIYDTSSRDALLSDLIEAADGFEDDEIFEIAVSALDKVSKMSGAEFDALELYPIFEDETEVET
jgi:hypothetical protein